MKIREAIRLFIVPGEKLIGWCGDEKQGRITVLNKLNGERTSFDYRREMDAHYKAILIMEEDSSCIIFDVVYNKENKEELLCSIPISEISSCSG